MDFLVDLPGGETVVVSARDAYLLAPNALIDVASCRMVDVVTAPLGRVVRKDAEGTVIESVLAELVVGPGRRGGDLRRARLGGEPGRRSLAGPDRGAGPGHPRRAPRCPWWSARALSVAADSPLVT